jgi:hypothetical protein
MSTKTTFKRIALVAVAALGLGVMSVAPSQATITNVTLTTVDGTASTTGVNDSSTAASIAVNALATAADSFTVRSILKSRPSTATVSPVGAINDTATSTGLTASGYVVVGGASSGVIGLQTKFTLDSTTVVTPASGTYGAVKILNFFDTSTAVVAGTYTYTAVVTPFNAGVAGTIVTKDFSIVVAAGVEDSKVASSAHSTAFLSLGNTSASSGQTVDSSVAVVSTASAADVAEIMVTLKNASATASKVVESVTATITGPGVIGLDGGTTYGKSIVLSYEAAASMTLGIRADGTAGVGTISISTPSVTFASKSVTFYAKAPKTLTAAVEVPVLAVGTNDDVVAVTAVDANGSNWAGAAYIYASAAADALIAGSATTPAACTWSGADKVHYCPVNGVSVGTAKLKVIDASTVALATVTSNEVTVTVSASSPASITLSFDKATYAPFEKATITVTPLDSAGKAIPAQTDKALLAACFHRMALLFPNKTADLREVLMWMLGEVLSGEEVAD